MKMPEQFPKNENWFLDKNLVQGGVLSELKIFLDRFKRAMMLLAALGVLGACTGRSALIGETEPEIAKISESELRAYCPTITLPDSRAFYTVYARKGEDLPDQILYQVAISDVTRACRYANGQIIMEVAAAGRVVPGPKFSPVILKVPVWVTVRRGGDILHDKAHQLSVTVNERAQATQFVFKDEAVIFEQPTARNIQVAIGLSKP